MGAQWRKENPNPRVHRSSGKLGEPRFPLERVDPRVGIFLSPLDTHDGFYLSTAYLFCTNCFLIPMRTNGCVHFAHAIRTLYLLLSNMSRRMEKKTTTICIGKNKGADQLRINCGADQCLCFFYVDSTIPLLSTSKISSLLPSSETVQAGLCQTWSEPQFVGFLTHRLIKEVEDATGEI